VSDSLVGNAAAREIRGFSAGADCVLVGSDPAANERWTATLSAVCRPGNVHGAASLWELAQLAEAGQGPLVVVDTALDLALPGTLDLLDSPTDLTAALVAEPRNIEAPRQAEHGLGCATPARVDADAGLVAVETAGQPLPGADRLLLGLLRITADDRTRVAELWRGLADRYRDDGSGGPEPIAGSALFDRAVAGLVTGGLPVRGRTLGYYSWSRGEAGQAGIGRSAWQQRLRSASRLGDGAYSAAVVRPLSRIGTRFGLLIGVSPNVVTMISLAVGIVAGLLVLTGSYPLWILAAVLLQLALVIDCMDGEIARFTRRFSAFGGWLDGVGDRIKEYLVFATVAVVAVRQGHSSGWLLAMIALVIVTGRHLEDYAYGDRAAAIRAGADVPEPIAELPEPTAENGLRSPSTRQQRVAFWAKKIAHVPIAERYLILSLGLLTGRPIWVLVAAIAGSAFALAWVVGGRLLRASRTPHPPATPTLDQQLDLGRLARAASRLRIGYLPGSVLLIVCWVACILGICVRWWPLSLAAAALAVALAGGALRDASRHRFGWLALPAAWAAEAAVIGSLLSRSMPGVLLFCLLAAIAYRRYELIYSLRLRGLSGPSPILGFDGRILVVAMLVSVGALVSMSDAANPVITVGLIAIGVATLAEAVIGTVQRWRPRSDGAV
jgi:hypothetical protein